MRRYPQDTCHDHRGACRDKGESTQTKREHYVAALMQRKLDCRNWRLVLTGHSLGAGAAALIALHLKGRFSSEAALPCSIAIRAYDVPLVLTNSLRCIPQRWKSAESGLEPSPVG